MAKVADLRVVVSQLQSALDTAHQRLREQQEAAALVNQRLGEVQEQRDLMERQLINAAARASESVGA